jgi:hypothetical protein
MEATSLELSGSKRSSQRNDLPDSPQSPSPLPPSRPATSPESSTAASPPEDPTAGGTSLNGHGSAEHPSHSLQRLEQELEAARDEINALHQMLEDLPEIFERKFRQRQRAFLDHHEHLLADNKALRERLYSLPPSQQDSPPLTRPALPGTMQSPPRRLGNLIRGVLGTKRSKRSN